MAVFQERYVIIPGQSNVCQHVRAEFLRDGDLKKFDRSFTLTYLQPLYDYIQHDGTLCSRSLIRPKPPN